MTESVNNNLYANNVTQTTVPSSLKEIEENPESFQLYMAQMTSSNINSLFSMAVPGEESSSSSNDFLFGSSGSGSDPFQAISSYYGLGNLDPMASLTSTGGSSDISFLASSPSMESFQIQETLADLQKYSDLKETKDWLGQVVSYLDPTDNVIKSGVVSKVMVENVYEPVFIVDDIELTMDDIISLDANTNQTA